LGEGEFAFDLLGATNDGASCLDDTFSGEIVRDVWFSYVPTTTGVVEIGTVPNDDGTLSAQGAGVSVRLDGCGSPESRTAFYNFFDSFGASYARMLQPVTAGVPVLIRIGLAFPDTVSQRGVLYIGVPRAPSLIPNDDCADATPISAGETSFSFDFSNPTNCEEPNFNCDVSTCDLVYGQDLFYRFTPTESGTAAISTTSTDGFEGYGIITKVTTECGGTAFACNVADCGGLFDRSFSFPVDAGSEYIIRVSAYAASGGSITLTLQGCAADFDGDGVREVPDIFAFLIAWFGQQPAADFDANGTIGVPDIFAFLSVWFAGC